ncbi:LytR/AlgR family response regulator transcription factor [Pseudoalteromonas ulvae]|uniref:DNA-binding response regulator n=1 Tax=Pseudoalteromonas ulvae TaxID=107327 RepID=A0A244CVZ8_PSEDV|nr:LytTR family DNA-binding domain-containing protein [Pseudoalteromonas ulvae]OUL59409.1 DNA-binding response regulator [Pseudoalteromonas ulvae]
MRVLIVDDEPLARARLKRLLLEHPTFTVIAEAEDGESAVELAKKYQPEVVFLDIEMPNCNGLDVAAQLKCFAIAPAVIFVTAYPQHALDAIQCAAVGYLLKPVDAQSFAGVISQLGKLNRAQLEANKEAALSYQVAGITRKLKLDDVLYVEAQDKYVVAHYAGGEALLETSLKQLALKYPHHLVKIHRKYLINPNKLEAFFCSDNTYSVALSSVEQHLEVSRRESKKVRELLNLF